MSWLYKAHILLAVSNVVITFCVIAYDLIFKIAPSPLSIVCVAFNWVWTLKRNMFWKDAWEDWKFHK